MASHQDHVYPLGQLLGVATKCFSHESLDSISDVGPPHLSAHGHPHSSRTAPISSREHDEVGRHHPIAGALNRKVLAPLPKTKALGQPLA